MRRAGRRRSSILAGLLVGWIVAGIEVSGVSRGAAAPFSPDTRWRLVQLSPDLPLGAVRVEAVFDAAARRVSGTSGCNRFSGAFTADGHRLTIGPLATTRMACPAPQMRIEEAVLRTLAAARSWTESDAVLVIETGTGESLTFSSAPG
jgi:heat shock protein HslJ